MEAQAVDPGKTLSLVGVEADDGYGWIDETTPIGRRFEFDGGHINGGSTVEYRGRNDDGTLRMFLLPDGGEYLDGGDEQWTMESWNEASDVCTGYTDPIGEKRPVDAQQPQGELQLPAAAPALPVAPADIAAADWDEIVAMNTRVREISGKWETAKEIASGLKKDLERAQERLNERIAELANGHIQPTLPFAAPLSSDIASAPAAADDDAWRAVKLVDLRDPEISDSLIEKLSDANITTLGELADYTKQRDNGFEPRLTDIDGIGPAACDKIEAATLAFWDRHKSGQVAATQQPEQIPDHVLDVVADGVLNHINAAAEN